MYAFVKILSGEFFAQSKSKAFELVILFAYGFSTKRTQNFHAEKLQLAVKLANYICVSL